MNDILFTDDLELTNGDFSIGESNNQHIQHILLSNKGEYKATPEIGVGLDKMLNTEDPMEFLIEAKKNLEYDGMSVQNIAFTENGKLNVDVRY